MNQAEQDHYEVSAFWTCKHCLRKIAGTAWAIGDIIPYMQTVHDNQMESFMKSTQEKVKQIVTAAVMTNNNKQLTVPNDPRNQCQKSNVSIVDGAIPVNQIRSVGSEKKMQPTDHKIGYL